MQLRTRLLAGTASLPRDLTRFAGLVDGALAFHRHAGCLDLDSAIDLISAQADPIDRAGFDLAAARRLAGAALAESGWRERAPGVWTRA